MPALEAAAIAVGTAVAKAACGVWLGKDTIVQAAGGSVIDLAAGRFGSLRKKRQFERLWDEAAEVIAERVEAVLGREFGGVPEHERLAAMDAVADTFDRADLTEADLFAQDLDATFLNRVVRGRDQGRTRVAGLSVDGVQLYDLLLGESCGYLIEIVRTLPSAGVSAATELLRRERQIMDDVRTVLARLPVRRGAADFERDYRQLVANRLDQVELFGVSLSGQRCQYPLSVAYLNLRVSGDFVLRRDDEVLLAGARVADRTVSAARVDRVLAGSRRLFVRGQAGTGKTTLLHWIAVQCARRTVPESMVAWQDTIPFFVSLRRYADKELPAPEDFLSDIGKHIADEKPDNWVHQQLRSGKGALLVDGVDELPKPRRAEARRWLTELLTLFPEARVVITSRPAAVPTDWLGKQDFDVAELEPMSLSDVETFVRRWHDAMREQAMTPDEAETLTGYESNLLDLLNTRSHLRKLASFPLLCALLCALHQDRRGHLPGTRMEFYEVALHMLLERRDQERGTGTTALSRTDSTLLLRDIAYWLVRNNLASASADRVRERIAAKLTTMTHVHESAEIVYQTLLERSGLLREETADQVDFVHRMFQDYLAAEEAVQLDDIGVLVAHAHDDMWAEVVIMAAGHATLKQRAELLHSILGRDAVSSHVYYRLILVAIACLETSPELPEELLNTIRLKSEVFLPPHSMAAAETISRSGPIALDMLAGCKPVRAAETVRTIRAITETGDLAAIPLLARFAGDPRKTVCEELLRAWPRLDPDEYARAVLSKMSFPGNELVVDDSKLLWSLAHVPTLPSVVCAYLISDCGLDFVSALPQLRDLETSDCSIVTLEPLAGSQLVSLSISNGLRTKATHSPLSLAPLASVSTLSAVRIWSRPLMDTTALCGLPSLRKLQIGYLADCSEMDSFSPMLKLEELAICHFNEDADLSELDFFRRPSVGIERCPVNGSIENLPGWAPSLRVVKLQQMGQLDLKQLRGLASLEVLDLAYSTAKDLASLANLRNFAELQIENDPDLISDVPAIRSLRYLKICCHSDKFVDLTPLAGASHLDVAILGSEAVYGASNLGEDSRVRRI